MDLSRYKDLILKAKINRKLSWYRASPLKKVIKSKDRYLSVEKETGVPAAFIMCVHLRENASDLGKFKTYIGNGQSLKKITTIVPAGRGPFPSWEAGVIDAIGLQGLEKVSDWSIERACYEWERYNGFGYKKRGINSPYVWSFTDQYKKGHYESDGVFNPNKVSKNIGCYAFYKLIIESDESLTIGRKAVAKKIEDVIQKMKPWYERLLEAIFSFFKTADTIQLPTKGDSMEILTTPQYGDKGPHVKSLQEALGRAGFSTTIDGDFGPKTRAMVSAFQKSKDSAGSGIVGPKTLAWLGLKVKAPATPTTGSGSPKYPSIHKFHPRFEDQLPAPYTHLHPFDVLMSVIGEKEIYGSKDNPLIAHFHEHSGNLGVHSENADYPDEVPHCASALNWAADMSGCKKSDSALAASYSGYGNPRQGNWVEVGDIIHKKTGSQNHVTLCNKRFNRKTASTFEGFGSNQGNMIKVSTYMVKDIKSVQVWTPLAGTVLAPIGVLGDKPTPSSGGLNESTR